MWPGPRCVGTVQPQKDLYVSHWGAIPCLKPGPFHDQKGQISPRMVQAEPARQEDALEESGSGPPPMFPIYDEWTR